eukprot:4193498-Heterocapsa_arctica.AAC.1
MRRRPWGRVSASRRSSTHRGWSCWCSTSPSSSTSCCRAVGHCCAQDALRGAGPQSADPPRSGRRSA